MNHLLKKVILVLVTYVSTNKEEIIIEDFVLKYFLEVKAVSRRKPHFND